VISRFEILSHAGAMERDRLPVWGDTLRAVRDFKWIGTGLGTYESVFGRYQTNLLDYRYEHAHSDYLEFAMELGVPAALLLFGGLWALLAGAARAAVASNDREGRVLAAGCAGALFAILLHAITDFNLQIPANALLFCWIAGTASAVVTARRKAPAGWRAVG
jgi:O-antigen ligase